MTDQEFTETARGLALGILKGCENREFTRAEVAVVAGVALVEVLGAVIGPVATVERLRDISDHLEKQLLNEMN